MLHNFVYCTVYLISAVGLAFNYSLFLLHLGFFQGLGDRVSIFATRGAAGLSGW
jgi:hypothetical protein